jgi:hypothetical protein
MRFETETDVCNGYHGYHILGRNRDISPEEAVVSGPGIRTKGDVQGFP